MPKILLSYRRSHASRRCGTDPPPTKWSDLRCVFDIKEDCNDKEALQARRDRGQAAPSRCSSSDSRRERQTGSLLCLRSSNLRRKTLLAPGPIVDDQALANPLDTSRPTSVVYMHNMRSTQIATERELVRGQLFVPPDANGISGRDSVL